MKATSLHVLASGRDNNFNLIRFLAASLVMLTHAYGLTGHGSEEPFFRYFGFSMGSFAVDVFFVTSGFLIAKSWQRRHDPIGYFYARFLRIYPALWVSVFACVFIIGPIFTTVPLGEYFRSTDTLKFFAENATLLPAGTFNRLPGVFNGAQNGDVNNPLWTLPYEIKMYIGLAILGSTGLLRRRWPVLCLVLVALIGFALVWLKLIPATERQTDALRFVFLFFSGSTMLLYSDRIKLGVATSTLLCASLLLLLWVVNDLAYRRLLMASLMPPLVMALAFLPSGWIRRFNRVGDYSYGIYIFGMPIQQSVLAVTGEMAVSVNFLLSYGVALTFAIFSWHFIEKKVMTLRFSHES